MNPFLEIPIVIGKKQFFKRYERKSVLRILPGEIAAHHPDDYGRTVIILKSGVKITSLLSAADLDEARQVYDQCVKKNPGRNNNLQIIQRPEKPAQVTVPDLKSA